MKTRWVAVAALPLLFALAGLAACSDDDGAPPTADMPIGGDTDVAPDIDAEPDAGDDPDIEADSQDGGPDAADSDAELRDEDAPDAPDAPDSPDAPDGEADAPDGDTASDPRLDGPDESDGDVDATADTDTDADTDSDAEIDDSLAIVGGWVDEHGTAHTITEEDWEQVRTGDVTYAYEITIFWPADEYATGKNQPSYDKQILRDYLETLDWDKNYPAPELPDAIVEKLSRRYLEICERITGRVPEGVAS